MNSFDAQLRTALEQYAREITVTTDLQQAERDLDARYHRADRRRRIGYALAAAAAVLLLGLVLVRIPFGNATAPPAEPAPPAPTLNSAPFSSAVIEPGITLHLPVWATGTGTHDGAAGNILGWECNATGCPSWHELTMWKVTSAYLTANDASATVQPTYQSYVNAWTQIDPSLGKVLKTSTGLVGGKPATLLTVQFARDVDPLNPCPFVTASLAECGHFGGTETVRIAIVDQGAGLPVSLLLAGWNTGDQNEATYTQEWDAVLGTVAWSR